MIILLFIISICIFAWTIWAGQTQNGKFPFPKKDIPGFVVSLLVIAVLLYFQMFVKGCSGSGNRYFDPQDYPPDYEQYE